MLASSPMQRLLLLALVSLLAAIGVVLLASRDSSHTATVANTKAEFDGPTMPPGLRARDFSLLDENAHRVTLSALRGRVVIVTFIHSLCKDDCPFMVEQIKGGLNLLGRAGRAIPAIGISVAPSQDTVANRRKFLAQHRMTGRLAFVDGPAAVMNRVWRSYAIQAGAEPKGHSAFVLLIDKRGFERIGFAADQLTPEQLAHDIRVLEAEPA
jgi:cytochrome oxidase Cu insertion factor (SCO1/SenC/PrrC family)